MQTYNKIMEKLWLVVTIFLVIFVTYLVIKEGSDEWGVYYIAPFITGSAYFLRRFMRRRMDKMLAEMAEKHAAEQAKGQPENVTD